MGAIYARYPRENNGSTNMNVRRHAALVTSATKSGRRGSFEGFFTAGSCMDGAREADMNLLCIPGHETPG